MAVPATPARMIAVTNGANSRIDASTKKPPRRSIAPNRTRKLPAWRPGRAVAERDRRDQQREPAQPQREQELLHELAAVRVRRPDRRHDRLAGQDHHVPDLLEQVLGGQECPIGYCTNHCYGSSRDKGRVSALFPEGERLRDRLRVGNWEPSRTRRKLRLGPLTPWYVAIALDARGAQGERAGNRLRLGIALTVLATLLISACGGSRQDAHEPSGNFKVEITKASFPGKQKLAKRSLMVIAVKNVDSRTVPNISVTVKSFNTRLNDPQVADASRPVFIVNAGPKGGNTANQDTFALGPLPPGQTKVFRWDVTAAQAGIYKINYTVSAGLYGKAHAVDSAGNTPAGRFAGRISPVAPPATVNFQNGRSVEGG